MGSKVDWTLLPDELLALVLEKLLFLPDYIHFGAVCKSWNDVARKQRYEQLPLLLVPGEDKSEEKRGLYNVIDNTDSVYQVNVGYNWRCCGSCHGCLFFASKTNFIISKPLTSNPIIELPPTILDMPEDDEDYDFCTYSVQKAVSSCDPYLYPDEYVVVVTYGYKLAIFRAGDEGWTALELEDNQRLWAYTDVIYYKGAFYAINMYMGVGRINVNGDKLVRSYKIDMIVPESIRQFDKLSDARFGGIRLCYLIESSRGELLCAIRIFNLKVDLENVCETVTSCFKIYKLEETNWTDINTLDGDTLFLGVNHSLAINMTKRSAYQPNSIYYTDDQATLILLSRFGPHDVGIFNLEARSFQSPFNYDSSRMPPSVWIVPPLEKTLHLQY